MPAQKMDDVFDSIKWIFTPSSFPEKRKSDDSQPPHPTKKQQLISPCPRASTLPNLASAMTPAPGATVDASSQSALMTHDGYANKQLAHRTRLTQPRTSPQTLTQPTPSRQAFSQPKSALLSLPYEIRHKIWNYILPEGDF